MKRFKNLVESSLVVIAIFAMPVAIFGAIHMLFDPQQRNSALLFLALGVATKADRVVDRWRANK